MKQVFFCSSLKPGLHIVVTIAEHACDDVLKRVFKLLIYRLQIFLVKYEHCNHLQLCEDQAIREKLKKRVCNHVLAILRRPDHVLAILTTYMEPRPSACDRYDLYGDQASASTLLFFLFQRRLERYKDMIEDQQYHWEQKQNLQFGMSGRFSPTQQSLSYGTDEIQLKKMKTTYDDIDSIPPAYSIPRACVTSDLSSFNGKIPGKVQVS